VNAFSETIERKKTQKWFCERLERKNETNKNVKMVLRSPLANKWNEQKRQNGLANAFREKKNKGKRPNGLASAWRETNGTQQNAYHPKPFCIAFRCCESIA